MPWKLFLFERHKKTQEVSHVSYKVRQYWIFYNLRDEIEK